MAHLEDAGSLTYLVFGEGFVAVEPVSFQNVAVAFDVDEGVAVDGVLPHVPIEFLSVELLTLGVRNAHVAYQVPLLLLLEVISGVGLQFAGWLHFLVELLQLDALGKIPVGFLRIEVIGVPDRRIGVVAYHTRVGDQHRDIGGHHPRYLRVVLLFSGSLILISALLATGNDRTG